MFLCACACGGSGEEVSRMHGNECFLCLPLCMSVRLSVRLTCAVLHFAFAIKKKGGGGNVPRAASWGTGERRQATVCRLW